MAEYFKGKIPRPTLAVWPRDFRLTKEFFERETQSSAPDETPRELERQLDFGFPKKVAPLSRCVPCFPQFARNPHRCVVEGFEDLVFCDPLCAAHHFRERNMHLTCQSETSGEYAVLHVGEESKYIGEFVSKKPG